MQDFYPTILKFAIVAALALLFIGVTFLPQQEATQVMGDNMDQALSSVKTIVEESNTVTGSQVKIVIKDKCTTGNTTNYKVVIGSQTYSFLTSEVSTDNGNQDIDTLVGDTDKYVKSTTSNTITFTEL